MNRVDRPTTASPRVSRGVRKTGEIDFVHSVHQGSELTPPNPRIGGGELVDSRCERAWQSMCKRFLEARIIDRDRHRRIPALLRIALTRLRSIS